ncbi:DUF1351 domain-containing protein [Halomonas janggokensis]|uniref:DUF1351 domain-containing protein n=1 Tax=Vreelandella janggokensis TaxID=370767 RepID=A0ABT4IS54_9GAMM|nr:DUF1351 domain-containing protein [Halomonas janggokensis]MCZ0926490.1 DUF1351 domain-containing protein [Halomonas janggokensis]MCZ0929028.1 DUF1351 domain-containing protein [Halomonas janggokensis]
MNSAADSAESIVIDEKALHIAEYKPTAVALKKLADIYRGLVFEVTTTKGMNEAKAARKEVRGYRTALENKRKAIKAPALQRCRDIDNEAKTITAALRQLEDPIDEQIKAEEQRKEREKEEAERQERERVANIRADIDTIKLSPGTLIGEPAAALQAAANDLRMQPIGEEQFAEFAQEALAAKQQALQQLASMIEAASAQEELAEMKRKQAEEAEAAKPQEVDIPAPAGTEPEQPDITEPVATPSRPIDTTRLQAAATATAGERSRTFTGVDMGAPGGDRTVTQSIPASKAFSPSDAVDAIRADLISEADLFSTAAEAVIEAILAGRIRHLTITE